ncbi:hypothetical protein [Sphingomonas sp. MMS24-J13]|uniref:hypothetical protein n=1 Tax=Sphingomonas sp. MMS24-J13 TaxID=3238686 RepID=UPI0038507271
MSRAAMLLAAALLLGTPVEAAKPRPAEAAPAGCGTACLGKLADAFLAGLISRKQGADVPWTDRVRYTENGVGMTVGDGIWATVTARTATPLVIADPATDSIVWIGGIEEHGQPGWLALRLKASGGRIAEAEAIIRRKEGRPPYADPTGFARDGSFGQGAGARLPRERLIGLAQGYLNSIAANDGTLLTRIAPGCERTENGLTTTSGGASMAKLATGCEGQIKAGLFRDVDRLRGVAFPVVDEERGLVVAIGMRDYSGRMATLTTTGGQSFPADTAFPHSYAFAMVFKISDGAIARIEEISTDVPYYMPAWKAR